MDVVCAVIKSADVTNKGRNDLFLIAKRVKNKIHAGKWEFPGGKVEHEENHSDAVKREVMEAEKFFFHEFVPADIPIIERLKFARHA